MRHEFRDAIVRLLREPLQNIASASVQMVSIVDHRHRHRHRQDLAGSGYSGQPSDDNNRPTGVLRHTGLTVNYVAVAAVHFHLLRDSSTPYGCHRSADPAPVFEMKRVPSLTRQNLSRLTIACRSLA